MNMLIKRRQLVMATLVVALGSAVFVNWYFTNSDKNTVEGEPTSQYVQSLGEAKYVNSQNTGETKTNKEDQNVSATAKTKNDYFASAKLKRTKAHDEALEDLKSLLKSSENNEKNEKELKNAIDELTRQVKLEADIEALIEAKLKCECIVILNGDSAEVVVSKGVLNDTTILQITDAILNNTKVEGSKIKVVEGD